ncbi:MAG: metallophosphoesterase [Chloroflexi bacterium]|nr:metallophosphoesterase [Chloroflexota bacterium]
MSIVIVVSILLLYASINWYLGRRTWQWLQALIPQRIPRWGYWVVVWLLASTPLLTRLVAGRIPASMMAIVAALGSYWIAIFVYAGMLLALVDLLRLIQRLTGIAAASMQRPRRLVVVTGAIVMAFLVGILGYGTWRARTPVVAEYALTVAAPVSTPQTITIVLISDTHLGYTNGANRIRELVTMANGLQPDLVLIAGDIIDDDLQPFRDQAMATELSKLQARLGIYAIMGNHDVRAEELAVFRSELANAGIQLLIDEWVTVDQQIVLVGRDDIGGPRTSGAVVGKPLAEIIQTADPSLPLLVMDHNPNRFEDSVAVGADLQVSGHTHAGQIFPFTLLTNQIYDQHWGTLKTGASQLVVSSGFGTWGPPIRVGTIPEVVRIELTLTP